MPEFETSDGQRIFYQISSNEKASNKVLLVMGLSGTHRIWEGQYNYLSSLDDYQVVSFDNRGVGFSSVPPGPYEISRMSQDIIELANHINWQKFHLIGVSMGGMISQHVALNFPERIQTLTLGCTRLEGGFFRTLPKFSAFPSILKMSKAKTPERQSEAANEFLFPKKFLNALTPGGITNREALREINRRRGEGIPPPSKAATKSQMNVVLKHALTKNQMKTLKDSKIPILAITGDRDVLIPPKHSYKMPSQIGAKLIIIKGAGHALSDQCTDEFNLHLRTFVDEHSPNKDENAPPIEMNDILPVL